MINIADSVRVLVGKTIDLRFKTKMANGYTSERRFTGVLSVDPEWPLLEMRERGADYSIVIGFACGSITKVNVSHGSALVDVEVSEKPDSTPEDSYE